jgi:colanic acid/amylovoran biosynthesis glycosyltransferase
MNKIAYLANSFPEAVEPYVWEEIFELRKRGREVVPCSFRRPRHASEHVAKLAQETLYVFPMRARLTVYAFWLCISRVASVHDLLWRAIRGPEPLQRRARTLVHTWLGAYLAAALRKEKIGHLHIHHGYFSSWAGMVTARFLGTNFTFTLHGSDLLIRSDYLDCKLKNCRFCVTVSEFNRHYIQKHYPLVNLEKIIVHRLGADTAFWRPLPEPVGERRFSILSVGRLHAIKNHKFLIRACHAFKGAGVRFRCTIAGEGEEREPLRNLIRTLRLEDQIHLCGQVPREQLPSLYSQADVVVLTSHSEGIPQTLMEAMAMQRIVLAPRITGMPELIAHEQTGFLYQPNSMPDFLKKLARIAAESPSLNDLRHDARRHIELNFNHQQNLNTWAADFLQRVDSEAAKQESIHANSVLQQVQLPVQRDRGIPV